MSATHLKVEDAITQHREAVLVDEAAYGEDFKPLDKALAERTGAAEIRSFEAFASAPCTTHDEVQRKLEYLLNGTIGYRDTLLMTLLALSSDDTAERFLRSLVLPAEAN